MERVDIASVLSIYRDRSANYGEAALFDHLPMTVAALAEMGAGRTHLTSWAERYASIHDLRPATEGELRRRDRWRARIDEQGRLRVIADCGAHLANGIGAAAFHAAIRAAYALERADDDELAAALEAWEREYLELPGAAATMPVRVDAALAVLSRETIAPQGRGLIVSRMSVVARHPSFARIAHAVPSYAEIDALALAAAAAFAQSGNFTALHVMTGTHAMRVLAPHFTDPDSTMAGFWRAYAAAGIVAGTIPTLDPDVLGALRAEAPPRWEPLLAAAIAQDDEHVIKSTYTAWKLDLALHDPVYRTAANRYLAAQLSKT